MTGMLRDIRNISNGLDRHFAKPLRTSMYSRGTYLCEVVRQIENINSISDYTNSKSDVLKLLLLLKQLSDIQVNNFPAYTSLRNSIEVCENEGKYYGIRMEVNVGASLSRKNMKYIKRESPDFEINYLAETVYIECTSSHLIAPKDSPLEYKIATTINNKAKKIYCNTKTALFIDITNLIYHNLIKSDFCEDSFRQTAHDTLAKSHFGSVIMFSYTITEGGNAINSGYYREDNQILDPSLKLFLDGYYPVIGVKTEIAELIKSG